MRTTNHRNYRRRRYDDGNEIDGEGATAEATPSSSRYSSVWSIPRKIDGEGATAEEKPSWSRYSSAWSIPRKIDGEGARAEAKPDSSLCSSACIYLMNQDGEEDVLPVKIRYDTSVPGCSQELYSFTKEQYPNVLPQARSSGLVNPPLSLRDMINQDFVFDLVEKETHPSSWMIEEKAPEDELLSARDRFSRMIELEDEFLSPPAPDAYPFFHGVIFNGVRMPRVRCRISRLGMIETYSFGDEKPPQGEDGGELLQKKPRWTVSSDEWTPLGSMPNVTLPSTSDPAATILDTKESHAKTFTYLTAPLLSLAAREGSLSVPVDKCVFLRKFSDSNSVVRDFLQEKLSLIEEIEVRIKEFDEKHASAILERRTAYDRDEMVELDAAVEAAMAVLNKQGNSSSAFDAATSAAFSVSAFIRQQIDEFGRNKNLRARFENNRASAMGIDGSSLEIEGESPSDEGDSETSAYKETRDGLLQCADTVFSDASDLYSRLSRVRTRFQRWKRENLSTYQDAYMYLNVPSIFSPYVRLELLKWDPLHQDVDFCDMKWHGLLFDNGKPEDEDDSETDDTDANLVSELVEKVAIPILHHRIVRCWDVLSTRETRNVVAATSMVKGYVPASSEALAELFAAIRARLVEAIAAITVPTWDPLVLKAVPNAPQVAAYRFGTSVRLMRNICMWKDILALPVLENLALSDLLFAKVLPHVRSIASSIHDAVTRTERIVASLSGVWTGPRTHSHPLLQPLVDCTLTLGRILETRLDDAETIGLARRLKGILVQIHEHEYSRAIVTTFNLKEAL
ncbi:Transcriptional repressor ILP1 [Cardamine amara subsp. amara]|uniref:Transcriptional repressor ILP1 n=1 Tax=Cardamine amara subsp. amara TaxID=228776 RepID=A0ABD0ZNV5_CARAN